MSSALKPNQTMRAVEITEAGGPDVLRLTERPIPNPKAGEILIKVEAAGVNRPDCLQRAGAYPPPKDASDLPGLEAAGTVVAIGEDVHIWDVGDKVTALTPGGSYAEYVTAPAGHALPWPEGFDAVQAAALPENYFTVWSNLFMRAGLQAGESLLVHGGSSGIGSTAIQMAKAFGVKVITTAGSNEKCDFCRDLGADLSINYKEEDWAATLKDYTNGEGVNVAIDMVAGSYMQQNINSLASDGRYVLIAFLQGPKADLNMTRVMVNRLTLTGSTLRPQSIAAKNKMAAQLYDRIWPLLESGKIKPIIHKTFTLEEAATAHKLMESSSHMGKIMLHLN